MATNLSITRTGGPAGSPYVLGTIGMLTSPLLLAQGFFFSSEATSQNSPLIGILGIIYIGGWICTLAGMHRLGVMGNTGWSRAIFAGQLALLFLALLFSLQEIVYGDIGRMPFPILDLAWPLSHTFMLMTGALVLKTNVWRGWRRFMPLVFGFKLPVLFFVSAMGAIPVAGLVSVSFGAVAFMLMAYAVRTSWPHARKV